MCLLLVLTLAPLGAGAWECPRIPYSSTRNFSIPYVLPSLDAGSPVQNVAIFGDSTSPVAIFVAVRNRILLASPEMRLLSVLITGPVGSAECEICRLCPVAMDSPEDTDNVLLLLDPLEPWLYSCGTARHGLCYQHQLEVRDGKVVITATHCLYSATGNSPTSCPDCVASPLGTSATVEATSYASFFYLGSTINSSVAAQYSPQSVSVRRLKGTLDGFADDFQWLTVLPRYRDNYTIHYVYSFADGDHVYFVTVQPEHPGSAMYHTRLARLSTHERDLRHYRELVLDCRFESKRRRRRRGREEDAERDVSYNVLQAAHAARPGTRLAHSLCINDTDVVLFGAFAESQPESRVPREDSAVCAFPLRLLNQAMEEGMEKCCGTGHQPLLRGLSFFQPAEYCPHNVSPPVPGAGAQLGCWEVGLRCQEVPVQRGGPGRWAGGEQRGPGVSQPHQPPVVFRQAQQHRGGWVLAGIRCTPSPVLPVLPGARCCRHVSRHMGKPPLATRRAESPSPWCGCPREHQLHPLRSPSLALGWWWPTFPAGKPRCSGWGGCPATPTLPPPAPGPTPSLGKQTAGGSTVSHRGFSSATAVGQERRVPGTSPVTARAGGWG